MLSLSNFIYSPLQSAHSEIRLLSVLPGPFEADVQVELFHEELSQSHKPDYEALSYVWGTTENPTKIDIVYRIGAGEQPTTSLPGTNQPVYKTLPVTQNLFTALRYLRKPDTERIIWIDAICINQNDIEERSREVSRMGSIYSKARQTIVWLGPPSEDSDAAIELMHLLGRDITYDPETHFITVVVGSPTLLLQSDFGALEARASDWKSIQGLLHREWFTRLWVWQELILSQEVIVTVGFSEVPWLTFRSVVFWFSFIPARGSLLHVVDPERNNRYVQPILRSSRGWSLNALRLLENSKHAQCSDPKDRIYGILSLLSLDGPVRQISPDYFKTKEEVYQDFVQQHMQFHKSLDTLAFCELRDSSTNLPSWVPDFSAPCSAANLLWPAESSGRSDYILKLSASSQRLHLSGVVCDTIEYIGQSVPADASLEVLMAVCRTWKVPQSSDWYDEYRGGGSILDALTKTMVCGVTKEDHVSSGAGALPTHATCQNAVMTLFSEDRIIDIDSSIGQNLQNMLGGRRFCTLTNGLFGAFPVTARIGDLVCVVLGSANPLLLRPSLDHKDCYQVVGNCYVAGLMDGEALLGPLPTSWRMGEKNKVGNRIYIDEAGNETFIDPRLGELPPGWKIRYRPGGEEVAQDGRTQFGFQKEGITEWKRGDPRLTEEALVERGVELKELILV